jgi:phosphoglycerate dehydrogenase-like enzyme
MSEAARPRVLIADAIHKAGTDLLSHHADIDIRTGLTHDELIHAIPRYDALVVRSATPVSASVIDHGQRLKVIARAGTGLDGIDVAYAREKDIEVINAPGANTLAVVEHTLALMLALARRVTWADGSMKAGRWEKKRLTGIGLAGKTLGIVGFGRIGRQVAIRAQAFGMKILVNQPRLTPELALEAGVEAVDLDDLLALSDFVTLHVPLSAETRGMIAQAQLRRMPPHAFLINTARGGVVDEAALLQALDDETLAGAALDVFQEEPAPNPALVRHPRVIATPHIGASTEDAQRSAALAVAEQIIDYFATVDVETVLPLRVVPTNKVHPHEYFDQKRVDRLVERLSEDGHLSNPPIVMEMARGYMVLDGATRSTAMEQMGLPHMIVQVIEDKESLQLKTWYHIIRRIESAELLRLLETIPTITLAASHPDIVMRDLFDYGGLCYLHLLDGRVFLVKSTPGANRLDALNQFTNLYIEAAHVSRTLNRDIISLQHEYDDMTALVVFPEYTVEQVLQVAASKRLFPAGITRFIIPGRVLRANVNIDILKTDLPLREKNRWLHDMLLEKQNRGGIRYYAEPVYLLDE